LKVTTEQQPDCTAIVTVEVDDEQLRRAMVSAAQRVSRVRPISGFRPGKAPYDLVERAVGKELLLDEAIDQLAQTLYKQVLRDEKIDPYDAGKLNVKQREPLILEFAIPTRPVVALGDYRAIHLKPNHVSVSDDEVAQVIERLRKEHAELTPVTRASQFDDVVTMDLNGGLGGESPVEQKDLQVPIEKESKVLPWLDQVVGAMVNEPRTVVYTFPEDDTRESRRGKTATYSVTITDIKEPRLPIIDDDFAKSVSEFETLDQLKNQIRQGLLAQKEMDEQDRFANEVVDTIVEKSQIAHPASMLEDEINLELERSRGVAAQLGLTLEKYLQLVGKSEAQFREEAKPVAEKKVRRLLTLLELVRSENISVTRQQVDEEISHQLMHAVQSGRREKEARRALSTPSARKDIEWSLKVRQVVEHVVATAKGEPTSGKIVTPEMVRHEEQQRAREKAEAAAAKPTGDLITDPSKIRNQDWPSGLQRPIVPGSSK
jgi:trigger factor